MRNGIEFCDPAAAIAEGVAIGQAALGPRRVPAPAQPAPLGEIVGRTAGSLFSIAERYELLWLERQGSNRPGAGTPPEPQPAPRPIRSARWAASSKAFGTSIRAGSASWRGRP